MITDNSSKPKLGKVMRETGNLNEGNEKEQGGLFVGLSQSGREFGVAIIVLRG